MSDYDVVIGSSSEQVVIMFSGQLQQTGGAAVAHLVESALMAGVAKVTIELAELTAYSDSGIQELSQGVAAGCRLDHGVRLVARDETSREAVLALCRRRAVRAVRADMVGAVEPR